MRDAGVDQYGVKIGGIPTSNLLPYADVTTLLETHVEGIERLTAATNETSHRVRRWTLNSM